MSHNKQRSTNKLDLDLGFKIRQIRQRKKMSLNEVADQIGISSQQLRKYELGRNRISTQRLQRISEILGVAAAELIETNSAANTMRERNIDKEAEHLWMSIKDPDHKNTILSIMKIAINSGGSKEPSGKKQGETSTS